MSRLLIFIAGLLVIGGAHAGPTSNPAAGFDPARPVASPAAALQQVVLAYARDPWSRQARDQWRAYLQRVTASAEEIAALMEQILREAEAYRGVHPETRGSDLDIAEWRNRARGSLGRIAAEFS